MIATRHLALLRAVCLCLLIVRLCTAQGRSIEHVAPVIRDLAPDQILISGTSGNLLLVAERKAIVIVGSQAPDLVGAAMRVIRVRYHHMPLFVLATSGDSCIQWRDGGWRRLGATTIAHENIRSWMRTPPKDWRVSGSPPLVGFSEVLQLDLGDDEVHMVHQPRAYSDADVSVHFERKHLLYVGHLMTTDRYPTVNRLFGGSVSGLIDVSRSFLGRFQHNRQLVEPIIPAEGPPATLADWGAFYEMLITVRQRVDSMRQRGATLEAVIAALPTRDYDRRWGRGPVAPADFVTALYADTARTR